MGKPGTEFKVNETKFLILDIKQGKNRMVKCRTCSKELSRTNSLRHAETH